MVDNKIKNKIIKFINKYLRIDMNDDLYFVKTFFPKIVIDAKVMDLTLLKKYFAHYNEEYYEYDLNDKIKEYKRLSLNKNKLVIAKSLKRGFVYNEKYDRLCIFSCGRFDLYRYFSKSNPENKKKFEYSNHNLINITAEKKVVDERYTTRLKNPSEAYKFIIDMLYVHGFHYSRGDMDYKKFSEITKEEKDVLIDIVWDLNCYHDLLIEDAYKYLYDKKIQKLYEDIVSCKEINSEDIAHYYFTLYEITFDDKYKKGVERAFECGENYDISNWKISEDDYNNYIKLMLMSRREWTYEKALRIHLDKYIDKSFPNYVAYSQICFHIFKGKNRNPNYEKWVDEFVKARNINANIFKEWMIKYSNKMWIKDILEKIPNANIFSLGTNRFYPEMSIEEIEKNGLPDFKYEYLDKLDDLKTRYSDFENKLSISREKARTYLKKYNSFEDFYDVRYRYYEENDIADNPVTRYALELEYSSYMKEILNNQYLKNKYTGIDVLDKNLIRIERIGIYRGVEFPKRRRYYFNLNDETKKWLIEKNEFFEQEQLSYLFFYEDDKLVCYYAFYDEESGKNDIYIFEK